MKKISILENGLVGTLFLQDNASSIVIVLGGSGGGLKEERARLLAEDGFSSLALAYFGIEGLPSTINQIPLEYFEKAIYFLEQNYGIQRVGLWGTSRGAEVSLSFASLFPERIHAIAAHVPTSVVYCALDNQKSPAWTYQGKPIAPNAPLAIDPIYSGQDEPSAFATTPWFLRGMEDKSAFGASQIAVEKITCPLLLISAQDDQVWPSSKFAEEITDRLSEHRSPIFYTHLSYQNVGHAPEKGVAGFHSALNRWVAFGGKPQDNAFAAVDWRVQTHLFFKERL